MSRILLSHAVDNVSTTCFRKVPDGEKYTRGKMKETQSERESKVCKGVEREMAKMDMCCVHKGRGRL